MAAAMVERAAAEAQLQLTYAKIKATDAELAVLRGKSSRFFRWTGVLVLGALALDYMWCEWEPLIKFRMRRRLESGEVGYPKPPPSLHLTVKPATLLPLLSSFTLLVGPEGCGKTMLLEDTVRALRSPTNALGQAREPTPCALLRTRTFTSDAIGAQIALDWLMDTILYQLGHPQERALLHVLLHGNGDHQANRSNANLVTLMPVTMKTLRVKRAFELLLEVSDDLRKDRLARGVPPEEATPVLLWDEMHALVQDARVAQVGGAELFWFLAERLTRSDRYTPPMRTVAAASSGYVWFMLQSGLHHGYTIQTHFLADPAEDDVRAALMGRGYTAEEAGAIVANCGTRMLTLDRALTDDLRPAAQKVISNARYSAALDYAAVLTNHDDDTRKAIIKVLDRVHQAAPAGQLGPVLWQLPSTVNMARTSRVLHIRRDSSLAFQSPAHQYVWWHHRHKLVSRPGVHPSELQ